MLAVGFALILIEAGVVARSTPRPGRLKSSGKRLLLTVGIGMGALLVLLGIVTDAIVPAAIGLLVSAILGGRLLGSRYLDLRLPVGFRRALSAWIFAASTSAVLFLLFRESYRYDPTVPLANGIVSTIPLLFVFGFTTGELQRRQAKDTPAEVDSRSAAPLVDWPRTVITAALFSLSFAATLLGVGPFTEIGAIAGLVALSYWLGKTSRASGYLSSILFGGLVGFSLFAVSCSAGSSCDFDPALLVFGALLGALVGGVSGALGFWRKGRLTAARREIRWGSARMWGRIVAGNVIGGMGGFVFAVVATGPISGAGLAIFYTAPILTMTGVGLGGLLGLFRFSIAERKSRS